MNKLLYVILGFSLMLFSCEREVLQQSSKVIISLPANENSFQNILNPLSTVSTMSDDERGDDEFNSSILPSFGAVATYPVNCYLVAIGSLNNDAAFSRNFCGKRSTVTGKIDRNYVFGPFVGLFSNTANVEIEVPPGDKRIIYVFGIHALNPAACLALSAENGKNPSSENFSHPHIVGKSATFAVASGQTSVVPINLNQPVADDRIDGCIIPSLNSTDEPIANRIMIERMSFPQNILITGRQGETNPNDTRCDYLDVVPKYEFQENATSRQKPAHVDNVKQIKVLIDGSLNSTFSDKVSCENNVTGTSEFPLLPTDKKVRRWVRLPYQWSGISKSVAIQTTDDSLLPHSRSFDFRSGTLDVGTDLNYGGRYVRAGFDLIIPDHVISGQCYQMFVTRKSMENEGVSHGGITTPFSLNTTAAGNVEFFSAAGCAGALGAPAIGYTQVFRAVWFRATGPFDLTVAANAGGFATPVESSNKINVKVSTASDLAPVSVDLNAAEIVRRRSEYWCSPILFRFRNFDKAIVLNPIEGNIQILFTQSELDPNISFYNNEDCSSSPITEGLPTVPIYSLSEFTKIYMKIPTGVALGKKTLRFKVTDGVKTYFPKYQFEVIDMNY